VPEPQPILPADAELVARWQAGDEAAASDLVRRHTVHLARFLAASGAGEDLDDVVQETFFRAFRRIGTFRGTASFRTWLMAIGSNALKDVGRRHKRRRVLPLEDRDVVDERGSPHDGAVAREVLERLEAAVRTLPRLQRDVFLMRAQQGESYEAIAEALGTTVGAARVHYHHAMKRLREVLE
jgi:RNA polymerase sigma-70 factor (ECF subfamily)